MKLNYIPIIILLFIIWGCNSAEKESEDPPTVPTTDNNTWFYLKESDLAGGQHHTSHDSIFGSYVDGFNSYILKGIDIVQATAPDGGGYFAALGADPPEAPIGYPLRFLGHPLLEPARTTSYCSGSSFSAFIEGMNLLFEGSELNIDSVRMEAIRMQEPDGGRREDGVKFWGHWNADGYGNHFALIQYTGIGETIPPHRARPGDFMNISWKDGGGHSVIFLGWHRNENDSLNVVYWSSQKSTNGLGDAVVPVSAIREVMIVRVTRPENLFAFNVENKVDTAVKGEKIRR